MDMIKEATHIARQAQDRSAKGAKGSGAHGEFLTFRLGAEEYGIDILKVQEIRSYEVPTRIANAPPFVKGVVNLRGVIVPIVDLRLKLACETAEYNSFTVVIVLNVNNLFDKKYIGGLAYGAIYGAPRNVAVTLDYKL